MALRNTIRSSSAVRARVTNYSYSLWWHYSAEYE